MKLRYRDNIQNYLRYFLRSVQLDTDRNYLLEMNSSGNMRIWGIRDVQGFDENNILVISDKLITEIKGENMIMQKFSDCEIAVSGDIKTVSFIKR